MLHAMHLKYMLAVLFAHTPHIHYKHSPFDKVCLLWKLPNAAEHKKRKKQKKIFFFLAIGNSEHPHQEPQIPLVSWEGSGNQSFPLSQEAHTIKESYFHKDFQSSIAFLVSSHPIIKSLTSPLKQIHLNLLQANYISSPL